MMRPRALLVLATLATLTLGVVGRCPPGNPITQTRVTTRGFVEPHTPGSGDAREMPASLAVQRIAGPAPDLNWITTVRTRLTKPNGADPRVVLILIPGFLGGAGNFDPVARDLVREFGGQLEVWAVERRSSQLEDRRGAIHARQGAETAQAQGNAAALQTALDEGVLFYFPQSDLDGDSLPDGPFTLPDALGDPSSFVRPTDNDLRFAAHWGVDTYVRDWRTLVDEARALVGATGLVLFGGHSMGTTWTGVFAAYDFDPGAGVLAGHELVDGLLLLEGGGPGPPDVNAPDAAAYLDEIDALEASDGPEIFLSDLFGLIDAVELGNAGELAGLAATLLPDEPALLKKTTVFGGFPITLLLGAPMTNQALLGFFLDDDFSTNPAFSASMGFSDNGDNALNFFAPLLEGDFLVPSFNDQMTLRTWKNFDDPSLPSPPDCATEPALDDGEAGCAILDNGPRPAPEDPPARWGVEREVTDVTVLARSLYETGNASEWYFITGRPYLDLSFGRDSSALADDSLLAVTQNANVTAPVLGIGGSNGLATTEASFASYLDSIATPDAEKTVVILEGYSHVDVTSAEQNEAVPPIVEWINELLQKKLLLSF